VREIARRLRLLKQETSRPAAPRKHLRTGDPER
jgi:hypothetical protein